MAWNRNPYRAILGALIMQIMKSRECVSPHEQVVFISLKKQFMISLCSYESLVNLTWNNHTEKPHRTKSEKFWIRTQKCSYMRPNNFSIQLIFFIAIQTLRHF